jgi:hypothetical protein
MRSLSLIVVVGALAALAGCAVVPYPETAVVVAPPPAVIVTPGYRYYGYRPRYHHHHWRR